MKWKIQVILSEAFKEHAVKKKKKICPTSHEIIMDLIQRPRWWSTHYCGTIQNSGTSTAATTTWKDLIEWSEACKLKMNEMTFFFNLCVDWIIYLIIIIVFCCSTVESLNVFLTNLSLQINTLCTVSVALSKSCFCFFFAQITRPKYFWYSRKYGIDIYIYI